MMMFRTIKTAVVTTLGDAAAERFRVIGYQRQNKSSDQLKDSLRTVQVYFSDGNFQKSTGRMRGHKAHDLTLQIDLSASAAAQGDLSVLESSSSTAFEKAAALDAVKEAAEIADTKIDELIEYVYQILMDARNEDLGLDPGDLSNRWIDSITKDALLQNGDLVVKTANLKYTCRVQEEVLGDIGNQPETVTFNSSISPDESGIENLGVTILNDNEEE